MGWVKLVGIEWVLSPEISIATQDMRVVFHIHRFSQFILKSSIVYIEIYLFIIYNSSIFLL